VTARPATHEVTPPVWGGQRKDFGLFIGVAARTIMSGQPTTWKVNGMEKSMIAGASVWEQQVYDHLVEHLDDEAEMLQSYERLADGTDSPAFAYLARLILEDERRHHRLLHDLAQTVKASAELRDGPTPIPDLGLWGADRDRILAETERYLALEKADNRSLDTLAKELRDVKDTTAWELIVRLIQKDNEKHQSILQFIHDRASERQM